MHWVWFVLIGLSPGGSLIGSLLVATIGAVVLLFSLHLLKPRTA